MVTDGQGGTVTLKLAPEPVSTRYVRIWMTESSNTCDPHGSEDIRNCVGYAIEDFKAGSAGADGVFNGIEGQNRYVTSSIDPWHAAADVNATGDRSASVIPHGPSDGG